ncbi:MAG: PIN domain-containing protein [Acidimicrobiales bacterium]
MSGPAGVLDTSKFIASEVDRPLGELPDRVTVSVVTTGELELGVLSAADAASLARRAGTLALARAVDPVPMSEPAMAAWARLIKDCRSAGIQRTVKVTDALIAATTIDLGLRVVTQDDDYDQMSRSHPLLQVRKV